MVLSKLLTTQMISKHEEMVQQLQQEARMLFYDRMMYEINDSLTSILAVCDVEGKVAIPKIKNCINRINESLNNTKNYQHNFCGKKKFDISLVLRNLVRVISENTKDARLSCTFNDIKAPAHGDQAKFEELFLHIFVSMFIAGRSTDTESEIILELRQKEQNAQITILKESHRFTEEALKQINKIMKESEFKGDIKINYLDKGAEVVIQVPLQFQQVKISEPSAKVSLSHAEYKSKVQIKKSAIFDTSEKDKPELVIPGFAF